MVGANPLSIVADCAVSDRLRAGAELAERERRSQTGRRFGLFGEHRLRLTLGCRTTRRKRDTA